MSLPQEMDQMNRNLMLEIYLQNRGIFGGELDQYLGSNWYVDYDDMFPGKNYHDLLTEFREILKKLNIKHIRISHRAISCFDHLSDIIDGISFVDDFENHPPFRLDRKIKSINISYHVDDWIYINFFDDSVEEIIVQSYLIPKLKIPENVSKLVIKTCYANWCTDIKKNIHAILEFPQSIKKILIVGENVPKKQNNRTTMFKYFRHDLGDEMCSKFEFETEYNPHPFHSSSIRFRDRLSLVFF